MMSHLKKTILIFWMLFFGFHCFSFSRVFAHTVDANGSTQIVLLGTGTPNADPDRSGPATAIVVNGTPYLVDFGPGVVRQAAAAYQAGIDGLAVSNITTAFVTHLHSDHTLGYPDLILSPWVLGRSKPLTVYGPKGLQAMTTHLLSAYQQDIYMRLFGLEPTFQREEGYNVNVHEIEPGVVYQDENVTVEAFQVEHGSWPYAFGYKFITPDKTIVLSGDTAPSENLVNAAAGCDVLIHEVYSHDGFTEIPSEWQEWQEYHSRYHTSTVELAEIAQKAQPELLVLYHHLFMGVTEGDLVSEIQEHYQGPVVSGSDLDVFE